MKRMRYLLLVIFCLCRMANAQLISNGDFEAEAIIGPGQSPVGPNMGKSLNMDPPDPGYTNGILAVPNWMNSYTDVGFGAGHRDAGLSRIAFDGSGDSQYAFINNWETRLSQITPWVVAAGDQFTASIRIGFVDEAEAGRFQLWAGEPSAANPDVFPPTAVLLTEVSAASTGWNEYLPDLTFSINQWHTLNLAYNAPANGAMLGQKLTLSLLTSNHSRGPTLWDDAALSAVPEASSLSLAFLAAAAGLTARKRHRVWQ